MKLSRVLLALLATCLLVPSVQATWSIVVVDRRTGELCIASATCIPRLDLTRATPVILVGVGGGVTQSVLDGGENKVRVWEGFLAGDTPQEILARIRAEDPGVATRQFGIVDFENAPLSFTGGQAGPAKKSVTGTVDDLVYAIQGNVLVHQRVIDQCEAVLRSAPGDLGQRVMAAMVRARELGGDGRCSCGLGSLGDCGMPEPGFEKSAHTGFLILARLGDQDGGCMVGESCADGLYTLKLSIRGSDALHDSPDPVDQLVERYAEWRAAQAGLADGLRSSARAVDSLPADGVTRREVRVALADLEGLPLGHGGATLEVVAEGGAPSLAQVGDVRDHGDGSYSFELRAGTDAGLDTLVIRAHEGGRTVTLAPYLQVRSDPVETLHAGRDRLSASAPEPVPFVVNAPERPHGKFWLFVRVAGMRAGPPGFGGALQRSLVPARSPFFPAAPGQLDRAGRAEVDYTAPPAVLTSLIGMRLEWSARVIGAKAPLDSNVVGFEIVP